MLSEVGSRCEAVEECYEFMLAYAAQGLRTDEGSKSGGKFASSCNAPLRL